MITKEILLHIIAEEKENFGRYSQACTQYQVQLDPLAMAKHHGKMEILQKLLQNKMLTKS